MKKSTRNGHFCETLKKTLTYEASIPSCLTIKVQGKRSCKGVMVYIWKILITIVFEKMLSLVSA